MARTARKVKKEEAAGISQEQFLAGVYLRLSEEDEREQEQNSIGNQKKICLEYLSHEENVQVADTYVDNGATGTNFHRPGFEHMIRDVQDGRINCIIVKDLSRFGRNYLETSEYLERIFPAGGVRFIAVNNHYDSLKNEESGNDGIAVPFSNIVNEMYARDISGKIRTSIHTLMAKGEYLPPVGSIPYGYLRDADRNTYTPDLETEGIVRMIFEKKLAGASNYSISVELNRQGIPSPGRLRFLRGMSRDERHRTAAWTHKTVAFVLKNETYTGCRIYGKIAKEGQKKTKQGRENWQYVYHAHPAIIDEDTFRQVQDILEEERNVRAGYQKRSSTTDFQKQILRGKVFCGDCGSLMGTMKRLQRTASSLPPRIFYQCSLYTRSGKVSCSNHYIAQETLLEKIENAVRLQIQLALELEQFLKCRDSRPDTGREDGAVRSIRQKQAAQAAKLEQLLLNYNEGTIDKEEYLYIKQRYDQAARQMETELKEAETDRERFVQTVSMAERWIGKIKEFREKGRLDRELVECLVDRINVYDGRKVEIVFTFKDEYRDMLIRHECEEVSANAAKEA